MTLSVALAVPEGLVIGADSRTSYLNSKAFRVASDYTSKVFRLSDTCVASTFGWAFLNGRNIAGLASEFEAGSTLAQAPANVVVAQLGAFFESQYQKHIASQLNQPMGKGQALGFIVAGIDGNGAGRLYECLIPGPLIYEHHRTDLCGAIWRGDTGVVVRLIKGRDLDFDPTQLPALQGAVLQSLEYSIGFPSFTLQDAIDFVVFLIKATAEMMRFSDGTFSSPGSFPSVGGPIDIAVVQPTGITWVQKKTLVGERPSPGVGTGSL
jgi:hypothetical protein